MGESVSRRYARYTSLSVLSMIGLGLYYLADTFFVANKIGTTGLAALNYSIPMYYVINGTGLLLGVGGATRFTIHKSRNETAEGNQVFTNMVVLGALISVAGIAAGWLFSGQMASFLGGTGEIHGMVSTYLRVLFTFTPCFIYNNILVAFMRNDNAPLFSTVCMVTGTVTNIVLDYVFIYPLDMGIFGAALATGISPLVGMVMALMLYILPKKGTFRLCRCRLVPSLMLWCCGLGTSVFVGEISTSVVITVSNLVIFGLTGDVGVAAYGVIANITCMVVAIFNGVVQGGQPLLSDYYARGMRREEHQTLRLCMFTSVALGAFFWAAALLFAPQITAAFNGDNNATMAAIAIPGMRIYFVGFLLSGVNMVFSQFFAAIERPQPSMVVSLSRGLVVIVIMVLLLAHLWGMTGVWMSFPATEVVTFLLALAIYTWFKRRRGMQVKAADEKKGVQ